MASPPSKNAPGTAASPSKAKLIRVLCFGDSLTEGYFRWGTEFHPYAQFLEAKFRKSYPEYSVKADVDGLSGDFVDAYLGGLFHERMGSHFSYRTSSSPAAAASLYDWTVVLGGTNDLSLADDPRHYVARRGSPENVYAALKEIWRIPLKHGSKVLALTVPELMNRSVDAGRNKLNELVKGHKEEGFYVYDLHSAVPYHAMPDAHRRQFWDPDGVHFTPAGYELIGQKVAEALKSFLDQERSEKEKKLKEKEKEQEQEQETTATTATTTATAPMARRKRTFRDDDETYEEEGGDPDSIDKGYIVVRRKDLE